MSNNHRKNSSHNSEAPELSNRFRDQTIEERMSEDTENISRYQGEVKREKTERVEGEMPDIGAELDLLNTVEEVLSSSNDTDLYTELIDVFDGDVKGKEAELQLSSEGYSVVDARNVTNYMIDEGLLEVESPGVYKPTDMGEMVYQVLDSL